MKDNFSEAEDKLGLWKEEYRKPQMSGPQVEKLRQAIEDSKTENRKKHKKPAVIKFAVAAAACIAAFILLPNLSATVAYAMEKIPVIGQLVEVVTFRDYHYEADRHMANIISPELRLDTKITDSVVQENLKHTTDEINAEIQEITDKIIKDFEAGIKDQEGYQDVVVYSEVLAVADDYFTLKLICYQGAGSGAEWDYFYTIDLNTGKRLALKDLFKEGADYITPVSENIKEQMREQMEKDENVCYWLENEIEEWNFKTITDETSFYLNEKNLVVIAFNEGDVAPMYMGTVEFEIPEEVLEDIRK